MKDRTSSSSHSPFVRNLITLFSGSVIAQIIPLAAAPLLSRLFTPQDFGIYELFAGAAAILAVVASARYELAIMLPDNDQDAFSLVGAATTIAGAVSILAALGGYLFHPFLGSTFGVEEGELFFALLPLLGFWLALVQIGHYWFTRRSRFAGIASRRIVQNGITTGSQIAAGVNHLPAGPWGLIGGLIAGTATGALWFFAVARQDAVNYARIASRWENIRRIAIRYREFPLKNLPAHLLNIVANQLPSVLFIALFGPLAAGFYALTRRVLATPLSFLADAFTDVFRQRASEDYQRTGSCRPIFVKTLWATTLFATPPFLALLFFAPPLFALVFGEPWREAGRYAQLLAPMYAMRFLASPLGFTLIIAERQNFYLVWQAILLCTTVTALCIGWTLQSAALTIGIFSGTYTILYGWLLIAAYRAAEKK